VGGGRAELDLCNRIERSALRQGGRTEKGERKKAGENPLSVLERHTVVPEGGGKQEREKACPFT